MIPELHARFLERALDRLGQDARLVGVAAAGSYPSGTLDEFSDLDLLIAVEPEAYALVLHERQALARELGPLLAAFTGEHVGEPRVLICLYGPPLLHVDLKFVSLADAATRVEDPAVLWERDGRLSHALRNGVARFPMPDLQWIEDRFWVWVHYAATKIGRGELFEAVDFLAFLRGQVLGPLALQSRRARPTGVRKLEFVASDLAKRLELTLASYDERSCAAALRASILLYREWRDALAVAELRLNPEAAAAALAYLDAIEAHIGPQRHRVEP
jgi:predicted nucleotidyltransferase